MLRFWQTERILALGGVVLVFLFTGLTSSQMEATSTGERPGRAQDFSLGCFLEVETKGASSSPLVRFCSLEAKPRNAFLLTLAQAGDKKEKAVEVSGRPYLGFKTCLRCHTNGVVGQVDLPGGGKLDLNEEQWVYYKEYPIWVKEDKHGQAYTVLLNERSKEMGKKLGVADIHRDQRCLACHTGFPLSQMPVEKDGLVDRELGKKLDINVGVSCEGCHGSAGDRTMGRDLLKGWMVPHQTAPTQPYANTKPWRFLPPKTKTEEFGFFDVRSPTSKTKLCLSCHMGDVEMGRVVTHEMYAVGHPPLPGFEIETFTQQMPRHWAEFSAKSAAVQEMFLKHTNDPLYGGNTYKKDNLHRSRSLFAGALVASSEYLRFVGQLADDELKSPVTKPAWPELAVFDCYACHHDLKNPSWRQVRKSAAVPGRPALQDWPFTLAKIALKILGTPHADYEAKLADLRQSVSKQPFGLQKDLPKSAQSAANWFLTKGIEWERKQLKQAEGGALLAEIAAVASSDILDYDSARQLVWAFSVVESDLTAKHPNHEKIQKILQTLGKDMFLLKLGGSRKATTAIPKETGGTEERNTLEIDLEIALPFVSRYHPIQFRDHFKAVAELLK